MSILQKNKKLAAGIGVAAVAAAAIALGAGTYAAFTDTEAGPGGTLAAGTLNLDVTTNGSSTIELFSADNIAPGYVSPARTFTIKNSGTINGVLNGSSTVTENTGGDLDSQLFVSGSCTGTPTFNNVPVTALATTFSNVPLNAGASANCSLVFSFPDALNNNLAQGDKVVITSTLNLTQAP
ncbi:TasA family protein [Pseudonocardia abyssalis]|uniref:SipW-cognate class signal peptide n=1 Tax=Pseudonocardia abyssalis TaxID=2792008 RepID=A0ABS6V106_9PSEU|nr:TasA family protein [Pseudonocardia abyssalis]MBW0117376.1 hypothetical protein [Pseudonocardia abyssalis]MBW0137921.1 hypothetical protein [Pseudonocardia abyssalis]